MNVLIDTHTFLWWNTEDPLLSIHAKEIIANGQNEVFLSAASVWEIVIKTAKGRLVLPEPPAQYISRRMNLYRFRPYQYKLAMLYMFMNCPLITMTHLIAC